MKINSLNQNKFFNSYNCYSRSEYSSPQIFRQPSSHSAESILNDNFMYSKKGNLIHIISFGQADPDKKNEQIPSLKMKVAFVSGFQDSISKITESDVTKHPQLNFELDKNKREIKLRYQKTGKQVGFIHYEILDHIYDEIEKNPQDFTMDLSHITRLPNIKYQGLTARINYKGNDTEKIQKMFEATTEDPECVRITFPYKKPISPEGILKLILNFEEQLHGTDAKNEMEQVINAITDVIKDPNNKNILLLGHKEPDGDDTGCLLGMKDAIELTGQEKKVDCAVDDRMLNLFKYLDDINEIKAPNPEKIINNFEKERQKYLKKGDSEKAQIFDSIKNYIAQTTKALQKDKKYDVVILMDISTPERLGYNFAKYINPDTKVIIIDHHTKRLDMWQAQKELSNIDIDKVQKNKLFWVADRVPAATEMVSVIASKLNPKLNDKNSQYSQNEENILKKLAKAILTGLQTDTSSYSRSADLMTQDMALPRYKRPAYNPIGLSKWFSLITGRTVTRKLIETLLDSREYKLKPIKKIAAGMISENCFRNDELQLNHAQITNAQLNELWMEAAKTAPEAAQRDILGVLKCSTAFKRLKRPLVKNQENDIITYLISQTSIKDKININGTIASEDMISFSFRSQNGTNHAAILANLFNGGGHGAAAGGRISGEGLTLGTKVKVIIDGKESTNPTEILNILKENFEIDHLESTTNPPAKKQISVVPELAENKGKNINDLIVEIVKEIRKNQQLEKIAKQTLEFVA